MSKGPSQFLKPRIEGNWDVRNSEKALTIRLAGKQRVKLVVEGEDPVAAAINKTILLQARS
jgi:hypothetical protein